jgi:hypothetical protein
MVRVSIREFYYLSFFFFIRVRVVGLGNIISFYILVCVLDTINIRS